jgi:hypothetical protein
MRKRGGLRFLTALLLAATAGSVTAQQAGLRTVALHAEAAPGFPAGALLQAGFSSPVISADGSVAFLAPVRVQGVTTSALYRWHELDGLELVARLGEQPAAHGMVTLHEFTDAPLVDADGRVAFKARLDNADGPYALFLWSNGTLHLLVRTGVPFKVNGRRPPSILDPNGVAVAATGTLRLYREPFDFALGNGGLSFMATLEATDDVFYPLINGLWTADPDHTCISGLLAANTCRNLAHTAQNAPGAPPRGSPLRAQRFKHFHGMSRSDSGVTSALVRLDVSDSTVSPRLAFYRFGPDGTSAYLEDGFGSIGLNELSRPGADAAARFSFQGSFGGTSPTDPDPARRGVFVVDASAIRQLYSSTLTPAPGVAGATLGTPLWHTLARPRRGLFSAVMISADPQLGSREGIWQEPEPGTLRLVAHVNQAAPGMPGVTFSQISRVHPSSSGQVALRLTKAGTGITGANAGAIWATDEDGAIFEVLSAGAFVEVRPGVVRQITGFGSIGAVSAGSDGHPAALTPDGQLALAIGFPFPTLEGVFVLSLPEYQALDPPRLRGLEVTQVVQDWNNVIPLVEHKATYVRAHFEMDAPQPQRPVLRAYRDGQLLAGSPLAASNAEQQVVPPLEAETVRDRLHANAWFRLPPAWRHGSVTFEVDLADNPALECDEAAGPIVDDCAVTVDFAASAPAAQLSLVDVIWDDNGVRRSLGVPRLAELAQRLLSVLPTTRVSWLVSVRMHTPSGKPTDDCMLANQLLLQRTLEGCSDITNCQRLYYGAYLSDTISGCAAALPSRAASGAMPADPLAEGRHTHSHEVGHMLGIHHSVHRSVPHPQGSLHGACSEVSSLAAPDFANWFGSSVQTGIAFRPTLGPMRSGANALVYGLDSDRDEAVSPHKYFDLMSYCSKPPVDLWPADVTYGLLRNGLQAGFGKGAAQSAAVASDYLLLRGVIDRELDVVAFEPAIAVSGQVPPEAPAPGDFKLRVHRGGGSQDLSFAPIRFETRGDQPPLETFQLAVPPLPPVSLLELFRGATLIGSYSAGANPPQVELLAPNGGETLGGADVSVVWVASDADGDALSFVVQYSADDGASWSTLVTDWPSTSYTFPRVALRATTIGRMRILASDGLNGASDDSDATFIVSNHPPQVMITPRPPSFSGEQMLLLEATAYDPDEGLLDEATLQWSSDRDGALGSGSPLLATAAMLSSGVHLLTAQVTDAAGASGAASIRVWINEATLFEDGFETGGAQTR